MSYLILFLLGAIWGASYLFIKIGGEQIPPVTLVAMRVTLAFVALGIVALVRREKFPPRSSPVWKWLAVLGVLNSVIPYTLITWGETHISSGLAAILVGAMPIFVVILAHWMTHDEKMTPLKVTGILVGFVGVIILFLPDLTEGFQLSLVGGVAVIGAAVSYAFATIYARRHMRGVSHVTAALGQFVIASIILVPLSLLIDHPWTLAPTAPALGSIIALAVFNTAFAYLLYYWLIANVGATRTSLVTYISPVIAVVLGVVFDGEIVQWTTVVGLVLIIAGVGLVTNISFGAKRNQSAVSTPAE